MTEPVLFIVTGLPATGKTTLARRLAAHFSLPLIYKDAIKEILFDTLGWKDRAWSQQLGAASIQVVYYFVASELEAGRSLVVENYFKPELDQEKLKALREAYPYKPVVIECVTEGEILFQRFQQRARSGQRHPGHVDQTSLEEFHSLLTKGKQPRLELGGAYFLVDTTELEDLDYAGLFRKFESYIQWSVS